MLSHVFKFSSGQDVQLECKLTVHGLKFHLVSSLAACFSFCFCCFFLFHVLVGAACRGSSRRVSVLSSEWIFPWLFLYNLFICVCKQLSCLSYSHSLYLPLLLPVFLFMCHLFPVLSALSSRRFHLVSGQKVHKKRERKFQKNINMNKQDSARFVCSSVCSNAIRKFFNKFWNGKLLKTCLRWLS